jgi:hypothetical protein
MAFKIKRFIQQPSPIDMVDPGKMLKALGASVFPVASTLVDAVKGVSNTAKAYKARNYNASVNDEPKVKVESKKSIEGAGKSGSSSIKGTSLDKRTYNPFVKTPPAPPNDTKKQRPKAGKTLLEIGKVKLKTREINIGDQKSIGEKDVLDSTPKISTRKPTIKAAPKDNSRKAIKARKTADKKAGVSKSQMRANKAKSKSEAALAKAKKSKNPDYKAQLKRKSDRLAARAKRKGGSPVKAVGDPKNPKPRTHAEILKAYPGAVKVKGKINTYKYKGTTLKPGLFPVESKGKTVKQAIEAKNK